MNHMLLRSVSFSLLVAALATPATAQEGTGHADDAPDAREGAEIVTKGGKGGGLTRKEKREAKRLREEQQEARKSQKKWEKMGLAARTAPEWYAEALERYEEGKYLQAREILLPLEDSPRAIDIQDKVKLLIADTYYYQGGTLNLAEALARYRTYLTFHPTSEHVQYARFQMGNCYYKQLGPADRDQSYTDSAIHEFAALIRDYPNGKYSAQAEQRMIEAKALRARHEFEVAQFYRSWGNHEASAARLEALLHDRPESPDREEALHLVADSLYRVGRPEDAQAYAARLRADYPGTRYDARIRPAEAGRAGEQMAKKATKRDKEDRRTHRAQLKREDRRTRQVRKDAGLPRRVPTYENRDYEGPIAGSPGGIETSASEPDRGSQKREERMRRLEEEEQEERARQAEREARQREKAAEPKSAKQLEKEAKQAKKEAKAAEKQARRGEREEAKEQAELEKAAEREAKQQEKRDRKQ